MGSRYRSQRKYGDTHGRTAGIGAWHHHKRTYAAIPLRYLLGNDSTMGGMHAGLLFSFAFTLPRALVSKIVYLDLATLHHAIKNMSYNFYTYWIVGLVMVPSSPYILQQTSVQTAPIPAMIPLNTPPTLRPLPYYMPLIHGFIAGWGTDAFALMAYTILASAMPNPYLGLLPGLRFGLGTMIIQILLSALIGTVIARRNLPKAARAYLARVVAGRTPNRGGIAYMTIAAIGLWRLTIGTTLNHTGLRIRNWGHVVIGFFHAVNVLLPRPDTALFIFYARTGTGTMEAVYGFLGYSSDIQG